MGCQWIDGTKGRHQYKQREQAQVSLIPPRHVILQVTHQLRTIDYLHRREQKGLPSCKNDGTTKSKHVSLLRGLKKKKKKNSN